MFMRTMVCIALLAALACSASAREQASDDQAFEDSLNRLYIDPNTPNRDLLEKLLPQYCSAFHLIERATDKAIIDEPGSVLTATQQARVDQKIKKASASVKQDFFKASGFQYEAVSMVVAANGMLPRCRQF